MTPRRAPMASVTLLARNDSLDLVPMAEIQGTLALDLRGAAGMPSTPEYDESARSRLEAPHDAEVKSWAARFAQAVIESIGGDRPVSQLVRWTNAKVYQDLDRRARLIGLTRGARRTRAIRPQVRSVHVCQPHPGCAEVSVHIRHGQRSRALAARLERQGQRWVCTALELG